VRAWFLQEQVGRGRIDVTERADRMIEQLLVAGSEPADLHRREPSASGRAVD
jgi:hypothetical protein